MADKEEKKSVEELDLAELEEIHRQLYWDVHSDEARAYLVLKMVGKVDISEERITKAIELYEGIGRYRDAAKIAETAGRTEKLIELHETAGWFDDAVDAAEKAGMIEKAIEIRLKAGQFKDAVEIAEKAGRTKLAAGICCKAGWFKDAAEIAEKAGMTKLAQGLSMAAKGADWPFYVGGTSRLAILADAYELEERYQETRRERRTDSQS